jgi:hypothetical protein
MSTASKEGGKLFERGTVTFDHVTLQAVRIRWLGVWVNHPMAGWRKIRRRWIELLFRPATPPANEQDRNQSGAEWHKAPNWFPPIKAPSAGSASTPARTPRPGPRPPA